MNVAQLIEALSALPQDAEVCSYACGEWFAVEKSDICLVPAKRGKNGYPKFVSLLGLGYS